MFRALYVSKGNLIVKTKKDQIKQENKQEQFYTLLNEEADKTGFNFTGLPFMMKTDLTLLNAFKD